MYLTSPISYRNGHMAAPSVQQTDEGEFEMSETMALLNTRGRSTLDRLQSYASVNRTKCAPGLVKAAEDRACKLHSPPKPTYFRDFSKVIRTEAFALLFFPPHPLLASLRSTQLPAYISQLTLSWMNPLLVYGYVCRILTQGDLLALPKSLDTVTVCDAFANRVRKLVAQTLRPKRPLLAAFNSMYGWKYYPLGLLKLAADLAGFAGPVLLHELVDLVEKGSTDYSHAYIYAALLCLSNFVGSVCNTQYSFRVSKVQVAVRAAVVTTVFRKSMRKRMGQPEEAKNKEEDQLAPERHNEEEQDKRKEPAPDETFATTGQVLNLMSTDCDRIANFCPR